MAHWCGKGTINSETSTCNFLATYPPIHELKNHPSQIKLGTSVCYHTLQGPTWPGAWALNTYSKISADLDDDLSLGRAYEAIAKVLQSQGEMTEAITYLKKVVSITKDNFQSLDIVRSSTMLGDIYNKKGDYSKASEYFQEAFDATVELMNMPLMDETKVHYGIAKAHDMMLMVNNCIESANLTSLQSLLSWKENRSNIGPYLTIGESGRSAMENLSQNSEYLHELHRFPDNQKNDN
ncbi:PREDICTED: tetratricopeptide repeat protein 29 [Galeopterus variegatus]|uniref:Tetratricopeptide repeat protein 29 n=1 Tax=Galeopterus variegatus TaxID=482537 RepID=A0ABM0RWJ2_GALVR|nr:PREDICTED: tetratricopeptide repeat protein 29 [Galeopterus variegatus]